MSNSHLARHRRQSLGISQCNIRVYPIVRPDHYSARYRSLNDCVRPGIQARCAGQAHACQRNHLQTLVHTLLQSLAPSIERSSAHLVLGTHSSVPIVASMLTHGGIREEEFSNQPTNLLTSIAEGQFAALFRSMSAAHRTRRCDNLVILKPRSRGIVDSIQSMTFRTHQQALVLMLHASFSLSSNCLSLFWCARRPFVVPSAKWKDQMSCRLVISPTFDLHLAYL